MESAESSRPVAVVTGASRGVGLAIASGLADHGFSVALIARSRDALDSAARDLCQRHGPGAAVAMPADLSSVSGVRRLAVELSSRYRVIDRLVNNAAVITRSRIFTAEGHETQMAVNHFAPFVLTLGLARSIAASPAGRVVVVSSRAHFWGRIDPDRLTGGERYRPTSAYAATKLANVLFTREFARRVPAGAMTLNCMHPGVISTGLLGDYVGGPALLRRLVSRLVGTTPERGARTALHLALSDSVRGVSGGYFARGRERRPSPAARDASLARALWAATALATGVDLPADGFESE